MIVLSIDIVADYCSLGDDRGPNNIWNLKSIAVELVLLFRLYLVLWLIG